MADDERIRWPPYPGFSNQGIKHPPGGYCAPNRCYCGDCPGYVPLPPIPRIYPDRRKPKP